MNGTMIPIVIGATGMVHLGLEKIPKKFEIKDRIKNHAYPSIVDIG